MEVSGSEEKPLVYKDATKRKARIDELLVKRNGHEVEAGVGQFLMVKVLPSRCLAWSQGGDRSGKERCPAW